MALSPPQTTFTGGVFMSIKYDEYIESKEWRKRAMSAKRRAKWRCQVCNERGKHATLNAHHRTYERLGNEWPTDLVVLCLSCHALFYTSMTDPKIGERQAAWIGIFRGLGIRKGWWYAPAGYGAQSDRYEKWRQEIWTLILTRDLMDAASEFDFAVAALDKWIGETG